MSVIDGEKGKTDDMQITSNTAVMAFAQTVAC